MSGKRYTIKFRYQAIEQVSELGFSVKEVADNLGVSTHTLYAWLRAAGIRCGKSAGLSDKSPVRENVRLRNQLRRIEDERDRLRKAIAEQLTLARSG